MHLIYIIKLPYLEIAWYTNYSMCSLYCSLLTDCLLETNKGHDIYGQAHMAQGPPATRRPPGQVAAPHRPLRKLGAEADCAHAHCSSSSPLHAPPGPIHLIYIQLAWTERVWEVRVFFFFFTVVR